MKKLIIESLKVPMAGVRLFQYELPVATSKWLIDKMKVLLSKDNDSHPVFSEYALSSVWSVIQSMGPLYGKSLQVLASNLSDQVREKYGVDRVYNDWDAMSQMEFENILDQHSPEWRGTFNSVNEKPLGVASMAEVRTLKPTLNGKAYIAKVLKPQSKDRLKNSLGALRDVAGILRPFCLTKRSKSALSQLNSLIDSYESEMDLELEVQTMNRVRKLSAKRYSKNKNMFFVPLVLEALSSKDVIVMEAVQGIPLSEVNPENTSLELRKHLSENLVQEMLIQIFEQGVFHADPHAGNLLLTRDETIAFIDWGLAGELTEDDRKFIGKILRSILSRNLDSLSKVLVDLSTDRGHSLSRKQKKNLQNELKNLGDWLVAQKKDNKQVRLSAFAQKALGIAEESGLSLPDSLLLMVKTLVTVEGLAKGLHEDVSLAKIGAPVLFRAFRPKVSDVFKRFGRWIR